MYCAAKEVDVALKGAAAGNDSANQMGKNAVGNFNSIDPAAQGMEYVEAGLLARGYCDGVSVWVCRVGEKCHRRSLGVEVGIANDGSWWSSGQRYRNQAILNSKSEMSSSMSLSVFLLNQRLVVFVRQFQFATEAAHYKVGFKEMH